VAWRPTTSCTPYTSRQELATSPCSLKYYYEGLKFYVEVAESKEAEVQQLMLIEGEERAFNQQEKDNLASAARPLSADLSLALQEATDTNLDMEVLKATVDRYQLETSRLQSIKDSHDRLQDTERDLVNRTRELDEVNEALVGTRDELSDLIAANDARERSAGGTPGTREFANYTSSMKDNCKLRNSE